MYLHGEEGNHDAIFSTFRAGTTICQAAGTPGSLRISTVRDPCLPYLLL